MSGVRIDSRTSVDARSRSSAHSVTITAASASRTASSKDGAIATPSSVRVPGDERVPGVNFGPFGLKPSRQHERRRLAHVVGVRLEREPEQRDPLAAQVAEPLLELRHDTPLLQVVHFDHGAQSWKW